MTRRPQAAPRHSCRRDVAQCLLAVVLALLTIACWDAGLLWLEGVR